MNNENELVKATHAIAVGTSADVAAEIYDFCATVTPQFYRNKTKAEITEEVNGIRILTEGIQRAVLAEMCELSVQNYGVFRSNNPKAYFDINYIFTFYTQAFNHVNRDTVDLSGCDFLESRTRRNNIITEVYSNALNEDKDEPYRTVTVRYIEEARK